MVDFGNIILNKWTLHAAYYWLTPSEYQSLSEAGVSLTGFSQNDDGNYYILKSQIDDDLLEELYDYDAVHYWTCQNSRQGAQGA